jgi:hypothetical protein
MNIALNPNQGDTRRGDLAVVGNVNFTGLENFLAKIGNNGGTPNLYLPASVADIALYIVMSGDIAGNQTGIETPDSGENCRLLARGTGNAGDKLILMDVPKVGVITGTSNATPDVITASAAHGLLVGQNITIQGVLGDLAVNGSFYVLTTPSTTTLTISATPGGAAIAGTGAYTSGGTFTANVGDAGKVRSLTGSLAPVAPGVYFRAAIAEEGFTDGQYVKARWFPGLDRIVSTFTATGTEATDIAALKSILEVQGFVA